MSVIVLIKINTRQMLNKKITFAKKDKKAEKNKQKTKGKR